MGFPRAPFNPWLHMKWDYLRTIGTGVVSIAVLIAALLLPFVLPSR